ncbi:unnamed protein product [Leuciscus chuanchicus]
MWRNQIQKPNAGCLSMPLFNQRKRSRLPLTSNPSESELFTASANHYNERQSSSSSSSSSSALPTLGQSGQWNQQAYLSPQQASMRSAASPCVAGRGYAPLPYPKKPVYARSQTEQQRPPVRQDSLPAVGYQLHGGFPSSSSASFGQPTWSSGIQNQQSFSKLTNSPRMPYRPQQCTPTAGSTQSQSGKWKFRPVGQSTSEMWAKEKMDISSVQTTPQKQKPPREVSLRLISTVIEGMKHWSQYKNRVPMLFEIFATLDSAVTVGEYGAKKFLMRDGKEVVQCLYFEIDQILPRLIRGQVHRCIGNYDREKDTMTCVSVRAASLSEQRNAQEAVRASDAEMRDVVLALSEI